MSLVGWSLFCGFLKKKKRVPCSRNGMNLMLNNNFCNKGHYMHNSHLIVTTSKTYGESNNIQLINLSQQGKSVVPSGKSCREGRLRPRARFPPPGPISS